ncbi:MAG: alpha/beta hydrolase, partial [Bacteroidota bacterium]
KNVFVSPWGLRQVMKTNTRSRGKKINAKIEQILHPYEKVAPSLKKETLHGPMHAGRKNEILTLSRKFTELSCPKHLIIAKEDPLCYAHIHKLSKENPEVPVYPIPNCGHFIPIDRPQALNKILRSILSDKQAP